MFDVYPVLLAGGCGTQLWPLSRKSDPKQFSNLIEVQIGSYLGEDDIIRYEDVYARN